MVLTLWVSLQVYITQRRQPPRIMNIALIALAVIFAINENAVAIAKVGNACVALVIVVALLTLVFTAASRWMLTLHHPMLFVTSWYVLNWIADSVLLS